MLRYIILLISVTLMSDFSYAQVKNPTYKQYRESSAYRILHDEEKASWWDMLRIEKYHHMNILWNECVGSKCSALKVSTKNDPLPALVKKYKIDQGFRDDAGSGGAWSVDVDVIKKQKKNAVQASEALDECQWDLTQLPRIISGPGCNVSGARLCRGMVICGNKMRLATCSENFCQINTATQCAKQKGYSSKTLL